MRLTKTQLAILSLIIANIIWGAAPPIFKWSLVDIPPFTLAFLRFFLASLIIFPFVARHIKVTPKDFFKILLLAYIGVVINISYFFLGLKLAPSINVSIIGSADPIFLTIGGLMFLKEQPKRKVMIGTFISLTGILLIILRPMLEHGPNTSVTGNLFFVISSLAVICYTLLLKKFDLKYSTLTIVFWIFFLSGLMFFPLFLNESKNLQPLQHLDFRSDLGILYGTIFSSVFAYSLYNFGVKNIKANEIGIFTYLDPIVTVLIALPLLGEQITFSYLLGALFVFSGIFIAEGRIHYHPVHLLRRKQDNLVINETTLLSKEA